VTHFACLLIRKYLINIMRLQLQVIAHANLLSTIATAVSLPTFAVRSCTCKTAKLITNFSRRLLTGHQPLDPRSKGIPNVNEAQAEALDAIHFTAKKMELHTTIRKGAIRLINNIGIFHRREAFEDKASQL
jgi:hypothetical protein